VTREFRHPEFEIQDDGDDLRVWVRGTDIELVLTVDEAEQLVDDLGAAIVFGNG